ncbi:hypothetical protein Salat_1865100 [Sesamum alatum]|uniref:CCHC-type domain-containing protein n=1 Tax=Sesamum alatum TaxID=300844 RepID=A0AAE2CHX5_9LAMI|nr:hypothetical protein Salat_1865100 [Sesamum alatum]
MQKEMTKRWAEAQRELVAEQEKTASMVLPKIRKGCREMQFDGIFDGKVSQACAQGSDRVPDRDDTGRLRGRVAEQAWMTVVMVDGQAGETRQESRPGLTEVLAECIDGRQACAQTGRAWLNREQAGARVGDWRALARAAGSARACDLARTVTDPGHVTDDNGNGKSKNGKKFKKKEKAKEVVTETVEPRAVQDRPKAGCYICASSDHRMRDCPKRGKLNALVTEQTDDEHEMGSMRVLSI